MHRESFKTYKNSGYLDREEDYCLFPTLKAVLLSAFD